eukprot:51884_1
MTVLRIITHTLLIAILIFNVQSTSKLYPSAILPSLDEQASDLMIKYASDWHIRFISAVYHHPPNQEQIYKIFLEGLVYNYYQKQVPDAIESLFVKAYRIISTNATIYQRMCAKYKKGTNPFYKLYSTTRTSSLKQALEQLAIDAKWDMTIFIKRQRYSDLLSNQQNLYALKRAFVTRDGASAEAYLIASEFSTSQRYLHKLTTSDPSWMEIELAITTFGLAMSMLDVARGYFPIVVSRYLEYVPHDMALLTAANLMQTYRVVEIIANQAPDSMDMFLRTRQLLLVKSPDKIVSEKGERLTAVLNLMVPELIRSHWQNISTAFATCDEYLQHQAHLNGTNAKM